MLVIATTNPGKFREFRDLLQDVPLTLVSLADFASAPAIAEDGATYTANAIHKAVTVARWTNCVALADDSGLEVDALGGAPGVSSARYAGEAQDQGANVAKLLHALADVPVNRRTARFRCVLAVARPDGRTLTAAGCCEGAILESPRGVGGFGYDPVFFHPPSGLSFAEIPAALKNQVSHRAAACRLLCPQLVGFVSTDCGFPDSHLP